MSHATLGWYPCPKWQLLCFPTTLVLLGMAVDAVCFVPIFLLEIFSESMTNESPPKAASGYVNSVLTISRPVQCVAWITAECVGALDSHYQAVFTASHFTCSEAEWLRLWTAPFSSLKPQPKKASYTTHPQVCHLCPGITWPVSTSTCEDPNLKTWRNAMNVLICAKASTHYCYMGKWYKYL